MKPVLVVYATRKGYTRKIAERVAKTICRRGDPVELIDAARPPEGFDAKRYSGAMLAASLYMGKHEHEMVEFVREHRGDLEHIPTAFLSVSLSEAGVEDMTAPFDRRSKAVEDVRRTLETFCEQTGFHPTRMWPVAGALRYSRYGAILKLVMRVMARRSGGDTDARHDYEYTDWKSLDRFVESMTVQMEQQAGSNGVRPTA
jgi:menaquinone-dependent protoporphyrinogen oxidase